MAVLAQPGARALDVLPTVLDNMIAAKRLPVMVAVMINSGGGDSLGSQRGLEYDTLDDFYCKFIESEVLPLISEKFNIRFTNDPEGRATMGGSSGAAAAFTMAWSHPELYRRVLSYSGTYVNQQFPVSRKTPLGAWEYHENLIKRSRKKPIRIWLHVSEKDNGWDRDEASYHNWVMANERTAAAAAEQDEEIEEELEDIDEGEDSPDNDVDLGGDGGIELAHRLIQLWRDADQSLRAFLQSIDGPSQV